MFTVRLFAYMVLLFVTVVLPAQAQDAAPITIQLFVSPADQLTSVVLEGRHGVTGLTGAAPTSNADLPVGAEHFSLDAQRIVVTHRLDDADRDTAIPVVLLGAFANRKIPLYGGYASFAVGDTGTGKQYCGYTNPSSLRDAFARLYGCKRLFESLGPREKYTGLFNAALWGWFSGNYYLFTQYKVVDGLHFGPFGMQDELMTVLRDVMGDVDLNIIRSSQMKPVNLFQFETAIGEVDANDLKLFGAVEELIRDSRFEEARLLLVRIFAAYNRFVPRNENKVVDGVTRRQLNTASVEVFRGLMSEELRD